MITNMAYLGRLTVALVIAASGFVAPSISDAAGAKREYLKPRPHGNHAAQPRKPGALKSGDYSPIAPGGLKAHEGSSRNPSGGHTILKHVGKSEADLRARAMLEKKISNASSFRTYADAQRLVGKTIENNRKKIDSWVNGDAKDGDIEGFESTFDEITGYTITKNSTDASDTSSVRVVLKKDKTIKDGYKVWTAYPKK